MLVVIYFGGFIGCEKMFDVDATPVGSKIDSLQKSTNPTVLPGSYKEQVLYMTCYTVDPDSIRVVESIAPNKPFKISIADFASRVDALRQSTEIATISVIGHSYGGWAAMKFISLLSASWNFEGLITIDPISRVTCTPEAFVSQVFNRAPGCVDSPKDFDDTTMRYIAQLAKKWQNFYQAKDPWLRSAPISGAENILVNFDGAADKAHVGILDTPQLIAGVKSLVSR
ncbi:MAG: alpha/beta hydrolase [Deltaproteobacteria bacterium]|nr:alpha/beta hydrolase [Deltaproteobacteria bacterium]